MSEKEDAVLAAALTWRRIEKREVTIGDATITLAALDHLREQVDHLRGEDAPAGERTRRVTLLASLEPFARLDCPICNEPWGEDLRAALKVFTESEGPSEGNERAATAGGRDRP